MQQELQLKKKATQPNSADKSKKSVEIDFSDFTLDKAAILAYLQS